MEADNAYSIEDLMARTAGRFNTLKIALVNFSRYNRKMKANRRRKIFLICCQIGDVDNEYQNRTE